MLLLVEKEITKVISNQIDPSVLAPTKEMLFYPLYTSMDKKITTQEYGFNSANITRIQS